MTRRSKQTIQTQQTVAPAAAPAAQQANRAATPRRKRSYSGADAGRLLADWQPGASSANPQVYFDLQTLRNRSRDLLRNNALAVKGIQSIVSAIVGPGIHPQPIHADKAVNAKVKAAWMRWASGELDVEHDRTWATLQTLWVRAMLESGSVAVRKRLRSLSDGLAAPLQLQTLEADFVDLWKTEALGEYAHITMGVEFDAIGRRVAYWLYRQHPGETMPMLSTPTYQSIRIPADNVAFLTHVDRPGQVHGVPWLSPVMALLRQLDQLQRNKLIKTQIEAAFGAFVVPGDETYSSSGDINDGASVAVEDSNGDVLDRIEPGLIGILRGGKDIRFPQMSSSADFEAVVRIYEREIAAGLRLPYERLTTDLSTVNYSSYRAGDLEFRRLIMQIQRQDVIPLLCRPVWRWFIEALQLVDPTIPDEVPVRWHCPKFEEIDPAKELAAAETAVKNGFASPSMIVGQQGEDFGEVMASWAADLQVARDLGLPLAWAPQAAHQEKTPPPAETP